MKLFTKQKQTQRHRKHTYSYQKNCMVIYSWAWEDKKLRIWDQHTHTTIYKTDNQQGYSAGN